VAEQALPEPYVPGSGDRVPAELRLVLAGYVGIAGGLFATALACAAAAVLVFFLVFFGDDDVIGSFVIALSVSIYGLLPALPALEALKAGNRFRGCSGGPAIRTRPR